MLGEKAIIEKRIAIRAQDIEHMSPVDLRNKLRTELRYALNEMQEMSLTPLESPAIQIVVVAVGEKPVNLILEPH